MKTIADDPNKAQGCAGWLKWLVGTGLALVAAGGSIVAILQYLSPPAPAPGPVSNPVVVVAITSEPTPDPTGISSEQWQAVEEFLRLAVAAEIAAYQNGVPSYATMFYGDALQTIQGQIMDLNARRILLDAHFDYDSSYIHNIRVTQNNRIEVDSCEYLTRDYYDRQTGTLLSSDSWKLVPQTIMIEYLNADFSITSVAFYTGQAFC